MNDLINRYFALVFPLFFVSLWLTVTSILAFFAGWFRLAKAFPDQSNEPILKMRFQSGMMGPGVSMNGILTLSACRAGLRVGMWRLFGPFSRDFFVPWDRITVVRTRTFLVPLVRIQFGAPVVGSLSISINVAARLAAAAARDWPEATPPQRNRTPSPHEDS